MRPTPILRPRLATVYGLSLTLKMASYFQVSPRCRVTVVSVLLQFHGRDGLGDVPEAEPSADSITLQPQEGTRCRLANILMLFATPSHAYDSVHAWKYSRAHLVGPKALQLEAQQAPLKFRYPSS